MAKAGWNGMARLGAAALLFGALGAAPVWAATPQTVSGSFAAEHGAAGTPNGTVQGTFDRKTDQLHYVISWDGLSGPVVAAHFHGPAAPGAEAGVMQPIAGPYTSPLDGTVTLTPAQAEALEAGKVYVNLHTAAHPNGEARAQLHLG